MKKALVTGANRSIGLEVARQLSGLGYFVYLGCRDLSKGRAAAEGLSNVEALQIDTADPASIAAARAQVDSLDVLINNAGISGGFPQPPDATPVATIRTVFDTNFFGVIETTLAFLDLLRQSPEPRIVQVTSGLASL
ncbi:MAG TPA: SDR family NAD(P)-dependent oxidoreductase, partial [Dinghuibacter sp.]|uniref:SDR family NAD(P)-dependent oxidoreductase n=1 Tax=Dinghuibacter sp. TaxID=2024697 RepID=UPI002C27A45B